MSMYDWSKLDAGWQFEEDTKVLRHDEDWFRIATLESNLIPDDVYWQRAYVAARTQLAKCRIRDTEPAPQPYSKFPTPTGDNTALFDAMDKMAAEVPAEEWAKVPPIGNCATERFGCTPCPACGKHGLHLCEKFYPEPPSTKWFHPSQPWCRGPLAAWTLVNISNHDGRLTVVMRRGRSEVLIETGSDDETLWERLGKKAVEADKAKSKEKCDV